MVVRIREFLIDRSQIFRVGRHYSGVTSGVTQWSVLGPLFFLAYVNDIWSNIESIIILFTDDCIIYRKMLNIKDVENYREILIDWGTGRKEMK